MSALFRHGSACALHVDRQRHGSRYFQDKGRGMKKIFGISLAAGIKPAATAIIIFGLLLGTSVSKERDKETERTEEGIGLTVYSQSGQQAQGYYDNTGRWVTQTHGFAVIKEWRKINLQKGINTIKFQDVASTIDATTVHFKSLTSPEGTTVIEQNYEYDLVNADKILRKYIDKEITLQKGEEIIKGTLLSFDNVQMVLKVADEKEPIQIIQRSADKIKFGNLPGGLITKPTLIWLIDAEKDGEHLSKVTYQAANIGWNADYTLVTSKDDKRVDLSAWVTVTNNTGAGYDNAELKLVAGDVHRVTAQAGREVDMMAAKGAMAKEKVAGFEEKGFFEYHLYTLKRKTTIPNASIKQIELFSPVDNIPAKKVFVYDGSKGRYYYGYLNQDQNFGITSNKKVDIYIEFDNKKDVGLGIPLPAGRIRVYKKDEQDGSLEFIGEDRIDHTPKDEDVRLMLGNAFDIVAERRQTDFKIDTRGHWIKESFEIKVKNRKDEDVEVLVKEGMYRWSNWEILESNSNHKKLDAWTVHFPVKMKKNSEKTLTYTVEYRW